jgi:hypothetical protein
MRDAGLIGRAERNSEPDSQTRVTNSGLSLFPFTFDLHFTSTTHDDAAKFRFR